MASFQAFAPQEQQQPRVVDGASLSLEQLVGIQRDLENEIQNLSLHLRTLMQARNKLQESQEALRLFCLDKSSTNGCSAEEEEQSGGGLEVFAEACGEDAAKKGRGEGEVGGKGGEGVEGEEKRGGGKKEDEGGIGGRGGEREDAEESAGAAEKQQQLEVLVPLTGSLYVKGRLTTRKKLLVDIGTGFWVEKTGDEANQRLERTSAKVGEQMAKVEKVLLEKQRQAEASRSLIQQRYLQQQLALQQQ